MARNYNRVSNSATAFTDMRSIAFTPLAISPNRYAVLRPPSQNTASNHPLGASATPHAAESSYGKQEHHELRDVAEARGSKREVLDQYLRLNCGISLDSKLMRALF